MFKYIFASTADALGIPSLSRVSTSQFMNSSRAHWLARQDGTARSSAVQLCRMPTLGPGKRQQRH
eukprot:7830327-Lingulodinium_polyedra.AAC.1